ncbi:peptide chain release factor 1 [Gottschalkia purinilytica]|uniref:Peptide chain release factor 2 n=1 Tax=Gottschalkia purinilytica TaxID=1503 RepID=A0A0L0WDS6_GOTPU|nr:peptide chain release factor 1 [Gottschalkia purinilytica]
MFLFDTDSLRKKVEELEAKTFEPDFWNDTEKAQKIVQETNILKDKLIEYEDISDNIEDLEVMIELASECEEESIYEDLKLTTNSTENKLNNFKIKILLSGEYDKNNAILSIHAGTGGLEAQDWAEMLLRMYKRWSETKKYSVQILDILSDTEGGIKSVTLLIKGINAYGYLKAEKGVHRLVRISPFDSSGRRHTSFASVDVFPELDEDAEIDINPSDLKIDTYRSGGAGGQHVNTTDSAIRITHIPTGIVVQCQNERSQHSNKATAMRMLMAKLIELKQLEKKEKIDDLQGQYNQIGWGSQIRSYVFHPYSLVKDHRTNAETGNIDNVMDGSIDIFINEYLKYKSMKNDEK